MTKRFLKRYFTNHRVTIDREFGQLFDALGPGQAEPTGGTGLQSTSTNLWNDDATGKSIHSPIMLDVSQTHNSTEALKRLEVILLTTDTLHEAYEDAPQAVALHTGDLLISQGVLLKMKAMLERQHLQLTAVYTAVPQTQQYALDEGLYVSRLAPRGQQADLLEDLLASVNASQNSEGRLPQLPPLVSDIDPVSNAQSSPLPLPAETALLDKPMLSVTTEDGQKQPIKAFDLEAQESVNNTQIFDDASAGTTIGHRALLYQQTLRSGQVLEAPGDVVIVGDVHSGSEIIAGGDVIVWGVLSGVAHAGYPSHDTSRIRALKIEAPQLRIGSHISRRPDNLTQTTTRDISVAPEVAKVCGNEIQIFKDPYIPA